MWKKLGLFDTTILNCRLNYTVDSKQNIEFMLNVLIQFEFDGHE